MRMPRPRLLRLLSTPSPGLNASHARSSAVSPSTAKTSSTSTTTAASYATISPSTPAQSADTPRPPFTSPSSSLYPAPSGNPRSAAPHQPSTTLGGPSTLTNPALPSSNPNPPPNPPQQKKKPEEPIISKSSWDRLESSRRPSSSSTTSKKHNTSKARKPTGPNRLLPNESYPRRKDSIDWSAGRLIRQQKVSSDKALAIFEETLHEHNVSSSGLDGLGQPGHARVEVLGDQDDAPQANDLAFLRLCLQAKDYELRQARKAVSLPEVYRWVTTSLLPALPQKAPIPKSLYTFISSTLTSTIKQKMEDPGDATLPTTSDIYLALIQVYRAREAVAILQLVTSQLLYIAAAHPLRSVRPSPAVVASLADLGRFWSLFLQPPMTILNQPNSPVLLPEMTGPQLQAFRDRKTTVPEILHKLLSWHNPNALPNLTLNLLTTYAFLREFAEAREAAPTFIPINEFLRTLLLGLSVSQSELRPVFGRQYEALFTRVRPSLLPRPLNLPPRLTGTEYHNLVSSAFAGHDHSRLLQLWRRMPEVCQIRPGGGAKIQDDHIIGLFDFFIHIWCATKKPELIQETLHLMDSLGIQPSVKTYTSMVKGWKISREPAKVEGLWNMLRSRGIQVDSVFWSARISALMANGMRKESFEAAYEMIRQWQDAQGKGQPQGTITAVKPDIAPINALLSGLLRTNDIAGSQRVLQWASSQGIAPNLATYNILISGFLRGRLYNEVNLLLDMMRKQDIEPDVATFTILIDEILGKDHGPSASPSSTAENVSDESDPSEKVRVILDIFTEIRDANIKAKASLYAKMIHLLLRHESKGNDRAVRIVINHMSHHGIPPTRHIFTIVAEAYFSRANPDVDAVEDLISSWRLHDTLKDVVFWECIIRGFLQHGRYERAVQLFEQRRDLHARISLSILHDLLHAHLQQGRWDEAKNMAQRVLSLKCVEDAAPQMWSHPFWLTARDYNLLTKEEMALIGDAMRAM